MVITRTDGDHPDLLDTSTGGRFDAITPGEVLRLDFMEPLGLSARALARDLGVPPTRITSILNGARAITADTALMLADRFETSAEFWMNLQTAHDLEKARERGRPG